jgi:hypothetical protein
LFVQKSRNSHSNSFRNKKNPLKTGKMIMLPFVVKGLLKTDQFKPVEAVEWADFLTSALSPDNRSLTF